MQKASAKCSNILQKTCVTWYNIHKHVCWCNECMKINWLKFLRGVAFVAVTGTCIINGTPVFGVTEASLSISADTLPAISLTPGLFGTSTQNISVTTDNFTGYSMTLTTTGSSTDLVNTSDSTITIPTISLPQGSTSITATSFDNEYGFSTDGTNFFPVPSPSGNGTLLTTVNASGTSSTTLTYGVEVDTSAHVGVYQNTFMLTVVANAPQYSVTYNANTGDTVNNMPSNTSTTTSSTGTITLSNTAPTRNNYNFLGWDEDSTVTSNPTYASGDTITLEPTQANGIELFAIWQRNSSGGGSSNPSVSEGSGTSDDPYVDTDMEYDSSTIIAEDGYYTFPNVDGEPEVVVENGEVVSFEYTDTGSSGVTLTSDGLDTGVLAFNGNDFTIILNATFPWTTNSRSPIINLSGIVNNATSGFVLNNSYYSQSYTNLEGTTYTSSAYINRFRCFQYSNNSLSNTYNLIYQSYTGTTTRYTLGWLQSAAPLTATIVITGTTNGSATNIDVKAYSSYDSSTGTGTLLGKLPSSVSYSLSGLASSGITVQLGTYELSGTTLTYQFTVHEFSVRKAASQ